jgi:hypothetical protein
MEQNVLLLPAGSTSIRRIIAFMLLKLTGAFLLLMAFFWIKEFKFDPVVDHYVLMVQLGSLTWVSALIESFQDSDAWLASSGMTLCIVSAGYLGRSAYSWVRRRNYVRVTVTQTADFDQKYLKHKKA